MSYILTGSRYIGSGTLPPPVGGYEAVDISTGLKYEANTSSTAWNLIGNVNNVNLGLLPLTGGSMTGAITGVSGWAPNDSPNFTTTAALNGLLLATTSDLATTSNTILNSIAPKITDAIASTSAGITTKGNIARATGILTFTSPTPQTIPLPIYPDGTTAKESDCVWMAFLVGTNVAGLFGVTWPCGRSDFNGDAGLILSADPTLTRTFWAAVQDRGGNSYKTIMGYFIEAIR